MNWEQIRKQLEQLLNVQFRLERVPADEWKFSPASGASSAAPFLSRNHRIYFYLSRVGPEVETLSAEEVLLTNTEQRLISMMLDAFRASKKTGFSGKNEEENRYLALREWMNTCIDEGRMEEKLPDSFAAIPALYSLKVPLLLYVDESEQKKVPAADLKKLLDSYFDAEILLLPLKEKEWLILGSEELLDAAENEEGASKDDPESLEDTLASLCSGLYEMIVSEWIGECHVAVNYPMVPAKSILSSVFELRESVRLGKLFRVGSSTHLPWELLLDKLLDAIPEREKLIYIERVWKKIDQVLDAEMLKTLEQFFELDCNVSETAKTLYIHRNTLLYRLDRLKQEIGLDVRMFSDAVLVKLALLLVKSTKRKSF